MLVQLPEDIIFYYSNPYANLIIVIGMHNFYGYSLSTKPSVLSLTVEGIQEISS
ncbi:hypothetical protein C7431_101783 [Pantoea allii]|uniref:Uncharacterized protein n=1 Tax=Pantoea allii TaxID=574096 RepID=A0A2V2BMX0_9GAMM|nr:hypothetical protein C7431_101783 [Pantoea allii]TWD41901.1 hypothetical protein FBY13_104253 [Pantoea sp. SJZ147]